MQFVNALHSYSILRSTAPSEEVALVNKMNKLNKTFEMLKSITI